jgi:tRNA(fMet)-specific endonuclease VapC
MNYVLDTNVVSALMRAEAAASARLLHARPGEVGIPQPVLAEVEYGLARLPGSRRRRTLEQRLELLLGSLERVLWNDRVSRCFGELKTKLESRGVRIDDFDVAIAAHAVAHGAILVTDNLRHFARIDGLEVERWGE